MFCPNCGKDCQNEKFCSECGYGLQEKPSAQRGELNNQNLVFPEPPIGAYKTTGGYLEISADSITFSSRLRPFSKRTIPFSAIYAVSYVPAGRIYSGALCVREWQDRHIPLASRAPEAVFDDTSICFGDDKEEYFQKVYVFLKQCADIVSAADPNRQQGGKAAVLGKYQGFYGYMELGEDAVTIYKEVPLSRPTSYVIPYSEIAEVAFREAKRTADGGLSIRKQKDGKFLKKALRKALVDKTSIDFTYRANEQMRRVYAFLMEQARKNTKRWSSYKEQEKY